MDGRPVDGKSRVHVSNAKKIAALPKLANQRRGLTMPSTGLPFLVGYRVKHACIGSTCQAFHTANTLFKYCDQGATFEVTITKISKY